jgi:hypothetical protein
MSRAGPVVSAMLNLRRKPEPVASVKLRGHLGDVNVRVRTLLKCC